MTARPLVPTTRVVKRFYPRENLALRARGTVCTEILSKARVISIEVRCHFSLETLGSMPACDSPCLHSTPHSPVVSLAIQLVIHDECSDSECLTA